MRLGQMMDPLAQRLLALQTVSSTQWLLRVSGVAATMLALMMTFGGIALLAHFGTVLITLTVAVVLLVQLRNPDTDVGLVAPLAIVLAMPTQEVSMLRAAGVGLALLLAHSAFALAATLPVHGVFDRSAWHLAGTGLLPVLVVSVVAAVLVVALASVTLGPWMMVIGVLAAIALFIAVLPRER